MKKVRFFSVAMIVIMALLISVWAATTHPFGTLNGIIATGQKTAETSKSCRPLTGSGYLTSITAIKGLVDVNQYCKPATQCRVLLYQQIGTNQHVPIANVVVPCGTSFSTSPKTITLPANTYPQNGTYCFVGEVTLLNSAPSGIICGISYTSGTATFNP